MKRDLARLIATGHLRNGTSLYHPRRGGGGNEILASVKDGGIEVAGRVYPSPSTAAGAIAGCACNGWTYWRVRETNQLLSDLRKSSTE